jgi:FtsH-binding integral membrane protein
MNAQFPPSPLPSQVGLRPPAALSAAFLTQAFTWMFAGLLVTAAVAALVQASPQALQFATDWMLLVVVAQLGLVVVIGGAINRIGATVALGLFFVYAATLGLTVGLIVSFYTTASVAAAFFSAAAMFGGAALYGATTKRSLAGIGGYLTIGVIGLVVAMVVNMFLSSGPLGFLLSIGGVILFTILTAYNVQRISAGDLAAHYGSMEKAAVIGALQIYLNFINIFLFLLRILGDRR